MHLSNHLLNICLSSLVYNPVRAETVWFISALYPQHLDNAWHITGVQWSLQKEGKQAGEKGDGQGVAESGFQPSSLSLQSPGSFPAPRTRGQERISKDIISPPSGPDEDRLCSKRGQAVPLSMEFCQWSWLPDGAS